MLYQRTFVLAFDIHVLTSPGCRAGNACRYLHDTSGFQPKPSSPESSGPVDGETQSRDPIQGVASDIQNLSIKVSQPPGRPSANSSSAAPQRPVSNAESQNPREFQINQLRRRFRPKEETNGTETRLEFGMTPSDPDFPFDMDKLHCSLHVPESYPGQERPKLQVVNADMDSDFRENVARGFDDIVATSMRMNGRGTLLGWMNTLDRQLERLLTTTERGPTLKFVPNVGTGDATVSSGPIKESAPKAGTGQPKSVGFAPGPPPVPAARVFTAEEKAGAEKRRAMETKQLESRLGRLPQFQKSSDGLSYTIPIQLTKLDRLPVSLRSLKTAKFAVPQLYPLETSTVKLQGLDNPEAQSVEVGYAQWVGENKSLNLMSQINYLTSNMHNFAKTPLKQEPAPAPVGAPALAPTVDTLHERQESVTDTAASDEKPHIRVVPRPPEWSVPENESDNDTSDISDSEEGEELTADDEADGGASVPAVSELNTAERGVALSLPFLELYGIELLELVSLYITIKCERCKEPADVKNIPQAKDNSDAYLPKAETCNKCANSMSVGK